MNIKLRRGYIEKDIYYLIDYLHTISDEIDRYFFYIDLKTRTSISYSEFLEKMLAYIYKELREILKNMEYDDKNISSVRYALGTAYVYLIDKRDKYTIGMYDGDETYFIEESRQECLCRVIEDICDTISWSLEDDN